MFPLWITHHMQSRELKMHDIIDLMVIFNVLVNEWPLKAHQINDQTSRCPPAPLIGWQFTGLQADTMLQTAAVALQQGHIDLWVSVWGGLQSVYSALTVQKAYEKGGNIQPCFHLRDSKNPSITVNCEKRCFLNCTVCPSFVTLV